MGPPAKRLKGQKALPWVRIPLSPPVWHQHAPSWLSGLERLPAEEEVTGSNPVEGAFFCFPVQSISVGAGFPCPMGETTSPLQPVLNTPFAFWAPVPQLDRGAVYETVCWEFESPRAYQSTLVELGLPAQALLLSKDTVIRRAGCPIRSTS